MQMTVELTGRGFALSIEGPHYRALPCEFRFPEAVWEAFPARQALVDELAYTSTLVTPLILKHPQVRYSTPAPRYLQTYRECFEQAIPNLVEWIPQESSEEILERFRSLQCEFSSGEASPLLETCEGWEARRVILPLSFGKDSLLSLAVLQRMGYEVIPVNLDERIQPRWDGIRNGLIERLEREQGLHCERATNEIQLLSDYQILGGHETRLYQMQLHFGYLFAMLPFAHYYRAPNVILSNEYPNTLDKVHREQLLCPHKYMQSREGGQILAATAHGFSQGQISAANLIGGLGNFAIHRILHGLFPEFGDLRHSCHLELSEHKRWCHDCERCAQAYLYSLALGLDVEAMGFEQSMLEEDKAKYFRLFAAPIHAADRFRQFIRDEERLAFLWALERGHRAPLIERFHREHGPQSAQEREALQQSVFAEHSQPSQAIEQEAKDTFTHILAQLNAT